MIQKETALTNYELTAPILEILDSSKTSKTSQTSQIPRFFFVPEIPCIDS